jgi:hypothetical protein
MAHPSPSPQARLSLTAGRGEGRRDAPHAGSRSPSRSPASTPRPSPTPSASAVPAASPSSRRRALRARLYVVDGDARRGQGLPAPGRNPRASGVPPPRPPLRAPREPRWLAAGAPPPRGDWRDSWEALPPPQRIGSGTWEPRGRPTRWRRRYGDRDRPRHGVRHRQHPTTAMCLRALEEAAGGRPGDTADLGTGSASWPSPPPGRAPGGSSPSNATRRR